MWFTFAVIALLCWSGSDLFSKIGCQDARDRYSHLKMVTAVGLVMGLHAAYEIFFQGVEMSWHMKEKRMVVKSLVSRLQNRFRASAAEIGEQDTHQILVVGVAAIVPHSAMADSLMDEISLFVEENCEAEILDEQREIR